MRGYHAKKYKDLVEDSSDISLQNFMRQELSFIKSIPALRSRTVVDLGAGHGRIVRELSQAAKNVIAIEINPNMYQELQRRSDRLANVTAIPGDVLKLRQLLVGHILIKPVFLITQNSLGTIEGDYQKLLRILVGAMRSYEGELVLGLFRQHALQDWGLKMYLSLQSMVGRVDLKATDVHKGIFASQTGYTSKWWTEVEIQAFKKLGLVKAEYSAPEFQLLRLAVAA